MKCWVDEMLSWWNVELTKCWVDKMLSWQNVELMKCWVEEMSSWWNIELKKCPVDKMLSWRNGTAPNFRQVCCKEKKMINKNSFTLLIFGATCAIQLIAMAAKRVKTVDNW